MAQMKGAIVIAMLALAIGQPATSGVVLSHNFSNICDNLMSHLLFKDLTTNSQKALEFAKDWLEQRTGYFSVEHKLIKPLEAVINGEECSELSWKHVLLLGSCITHWYMFSIENPLKSYVTRCFTPEYVSKKVESQVSGPLAIKVDFISAEFIKNYHEHNPNETPLHVDYRNSIVTKKDNCCHPVRSIGVIVNSIKKDFEMSGRHIGELRGNKAMLEDYLDKVLFKPCENYSYQLRDFEDEIVTVSNYYARGQVALLSTLEPPAQDALFRYKYCSQLALNREEVISEIESRYGLV